MRMQQTACAVIASLGLLAGPQLAGADDGPPPVPGKTYCKENPGKCEEARARREEYCKGNAEACKEQRMQAKQKRAERKAYCKENPEVCEKQREQMKAKKAELEARCKADPAKCEELKEEARQRWRDRNKPATPPGQY